MRRVEDREIDGDWSGMHVEPELGWKAGQHEKANQIPCDQTRIIDVVRFASFARERRISECRSGIGDLVMSARKINC